MKTRKCKAKLTKSRKLIWQEMCEDRKQAMQSQNTTTQTRITAHAVSNASDGTKTITTLDDYYQDCLTQLLNSNGNSVTFSNIIDNEKLWNKIVKAYENGDYEEGYATRILVERHMAGCTVDVTGTLQSDGTYLVKHTFTMK